MPAKPGIIVNCPGLPPFDLRYLVLDLNGTISLDGELIEGVAERVRRLAGSLDVSVLTADTRGTARAIAEALHSGLYRFDQGLESHQKREVVRRLGADHVVAVGNGANDGLMLEAAAIGVAVLGREGLAREAREGAHIVVPHINDALDLLLLPQRLIATLRR